MTEYSFSILLKTLQSITEKAYNAPAIFGTYDTLVRHFKKPIFFGRVPKKSAKEEKIWKILQFHSFVFLGARREAQLIN